MVISTIKQFLTKTIIFRCTVNPNVSRWSENINKYARPVFPDHLSVSYDYGARNLDEYFHFYSISNQKLKMKEFFKKLNNCVPKKMLRFWAVTEFHISRCSFWVTLTVVVYCWLVYTFESLLALQMKRIKHI